jgi:NitT/TauT family transport system substrate-binding protein
MTSRRSVLRAAAIGTAAILMAAAEPARAQTEEVTYLLPAAAFLPAFGPWMLAQTRGYYTQEGLKVNFVVAKGGVDVAKQVGAGNAPIGGAIGDTPIIARAQGVPVKAVARSPSSWCTTARASTGHATSRAGPSPRWPTRTPRSTRCRECSPRPV